MKKSIVLNVGSELLRGVIPNTNLYEISRILSKHGIAILKSIALPDNKEEIAKELRYYVGKVDLILITGGLGPTPDDVTREGVAEALSRPLEFSESLFDQLKEKFRLFGIPDSPTLKKYALKVKGAKIIENEKGVAPGQILEHEGTQVLLLPGPPKEAVSVLKNFLKNYTEEKSEECLLVRTYGLKENELYEHLKDILQRLQFGIYPSLRGVDLSISAENRESLEKAVGEIRSRLKFFIYAYGENNIEEVIGEKLSALHYTVSVAESCTGGLLGNLITDVSGSSNYFMGGIISYSNSAKVNLLKVPKGIIEKYGAVSTECAYYMAKGVKDVFNTHVGLSITGIAGPTGGTKEKPVGLVYTGIALGERVYVFKNIFGGDRKDIKLKSALDTLYKLNWILDGVDFSKNLIEL